MPLCQTCQLGLTSCCLEISSESSLPSPEVESDLSLISEDEENEDRRNSVRESNSRTREGRNSSRGGSGRDSALKDQQSTGRKRAAKLYPLDPNAACEWQAKSNCGGGKFPILGCVSGTQQARHHGPDKNVTNNEQGNVHRICHYCHNRWHVLNDPGYDWNVTNHAQHLPRDMTPEELRAAVLDEMRYLGSKQRKVKD